MKTWQYVLMVIGALSILLFIYLLVVGVKIASTIFIYIVGAIAVLAVIGFVVYLFRKRGGGRDD